MNRNEPNSLMVPPARFQRATSRLGGERSMQLSYGSLFNLVSEANDNHFYPTIQRNCREQCPDLECGDLSPLW